MLRVLLIILLSSLYLGCTALSGSSSSSSSAVPGLIVGDVIKLDEDVVVNATNVAAYTISGACGANGDDYLKIFVGDNDTEGTRFECPQNRFSATVDFSAQTDGEFVLRFVVWNAAEEKLGEITFTAQKDTLAPTNGRRGD